MRLLSSSGSFMAVLYTHTHTHTHTLTHTLTHIHTFHIHTHTCIHAHTMYLTDRAKEAEDCYCKALSIKADHINANTNMAHLCRIQERWEEAVTYYSTALRRRPKNPLLHYYLGFVYERLGSAEGRQVGQCVFLIFCIISLSLSFPLSTIMTM